MKVGLRPWARAGTRPAKGVVETMGRGRFGSAPMFYVEHRCIHGYCSQTTRVILRRLEYTYTIGDGETERTITAFVPMSSRELRTEFSGEVETLGIGHNNEHVTLMGWDGTRAGAHRMAPCGGCFKLWSIDDEIASND